MKGCEPSAADNVLCSFLGFSFLGTYMYENVLSAPLWFGCCTRLSYTSVEERRDVVPKNLEHCFYPERKERG